VAQKHNENRNALVSLHRGGTACNGCVVGHSRVLRDGRNQGVVGRNKHKAALGHLVDALCEQKEENTASAVERERYGMAVFGMLQTRTLAEVVRRITRELLRKLCNKNKNVSNVGQ
jgi:alpha-D-ribose 1-methylphosphonate 5-triphosphate synthase subunit PhnG